MAIATLPASAWDKEKAGVLLQRAGFGGTPQEVEALAKMQPWQAADSLLGPPEIPHVDPPPSILKPAIGDKLRTDRNRLKLMDPKVREDKQREINRALKAEQEKRLTDLRGWWFQRMADPAKAAREKVVLFLHGHFATSEEKVRNPAVLYQQNRLFREKALGSWSDLVLGVAKDPAMLNYLDGAKSRSEHPNENFARELFELFTLGEGHYTEKDIQGGRPRLHRMVGPFALQTRGSDGRGNPHALLCQSAGLARWKTKKGFRENRQLRRRGCGPPHLATAGRITLDHRQALALLYRHPSSGGAPQGTGGGVGGKPRPASAFSSGHLDPSGILQDWAQPATG